MLSVAVVNGGLLIMSVSGGMGLPQRDAVQLDDKGRAGANTLLLTAQIVDARPKFRSFMNRFL
jgi:hypothetical protein